MYEVERIRSEIRDTVAGDPWYGLSVCAVLDGIDANAASARPIEGVHSAWEIVLHMTTWTRETTRRVIGGADDPPVGGNWPWVGETGPEAWRAAVEGLRDAHKELEAAVANLDASDLDSQVGRQVDSAGRPVTVYRTVIGLLQHDAFHIGQIAQLGRIPRVRKGSG